MNNSTLKPFWLVWCLNGNTPTRMHDSLDSACREAERLARANNGNTFVVMQSYGAAVVNPVTKIDLRPEEGPRDDIPF